MNSPANNPSIIIIGAGSVGSRHLANFLSLGCAVSAYDPRPDRLTQAKKKFPNVRCVSDYNEALSKVNQFEGAILCSPTKFHATQCLDFATRGVPVLLEKPLAMTLQEALVLEAALNARSPVPVLLGYTYRWWPAIQHFLRLIQSGDHGRPLHGSFVMSAHLADWHPWERYQDFFMASRELGGGALLDESHWIDLLILCFGMPKSVWARVEKISSLEIDSDDNVDAVFAFENGLRVSLHLDLYGRPHRKSISLVCENGSIDWSFEPNVLRTYEGQAGPWKETVFHHERNDMFLSAAREFLEVIAHRGNLTCSVRDGIQVLRIVEACRESFKLGREVLITTA